MTQETRCIKRMSFLSALNEMIKDNSKWIRPLIWAKIYSQAIAIGHRGELVIVPSATGGTPWNPLALTLLGDWEIIDPSVVLEEST